MGAKPPGEVYTATVNFLSSYSDNPHATSVYIDVSEFSIVKFFKYCLLFGIPSVYWSNYPGNGLKLSYRFLSNKKLEQHVKLISTYPDLTLCLLWQFKFVNAGNKEILPGQAELPTLDPRLRNSQIYLRLNAMNSTASVWFAFPFNDLREDELDYIKGIQGMLPFKFSDHNWRIWKKSVNGNWVPGKVSPAKLKTNGTGQSSN